MAKKSKNKKNAVFAHDSEAQTIQLDAASAVDSSIPQTLAASPDSFIQMDRLTPENKAKLDMYDKIQSENVALNNRVSELTEQLAVMFEKQETLAANTADKSQNGHSHECEQTISQMKHEIDDLNSRIQAMKEENDQCLVKISDLSFENTRLRMQIQSAQSSAQAPRNATPIRCEHTCSQYERPSQLAAPKSAVNVKYIHSMSGYSDWN